MAEVWDPKLEQRVVAVVKGMAARKFHLFVHFKDLAFEDLVQESLRASIEAWPNFNPDRGSWSTFVYTAASRRLLQICRDRTRAARRDASVAIEPDGAERCERQDLEDDEVEELPLPVWIRNVYIAAKDRHGASRERVGRKFFSPAQATAAVVLMARLKLTPAGMVRVLGSWRELGEAMRFAHTPSESWFRRAWEFARRYRDLDVLRARWEAMQGIVSQTTKAERKPMTPKRRPTPATIPDKQLLEAIQRLLPAATYQRALERFNKAERELAAARSALKAAADKLRPIHRELVKLSAVKRPAPAAKANNKPEPTHEAQAQKASAA